MEKEIFKDIPGYENEYQVSNLGRVKSLKCGKEKILKQVKDKTRGYYFVGLSINGKCKPYLTHQLVAMAFLNHKPDKSKIVVDHINNIKNDNRLENLQVISQRENCSKDKKGIVGVCEIKKNYFRSQIRINNKLIYLINTKDEELAALYYKIALENIDKYKGDNKKFKEFIKQEIYKKSTLSKK